MEAEEGINVVKRPKGWGSRHTMAILGCWAFAMSYAMRFNISIAIVSMVNQTGNAGHHGGGMSNGSDDSSMTCDHLRHRPEQDGDMLFDANGTILDGEDVPDSDDGGEFNWSAKEQGNILGSFFYGYVLTQMPGGILSHKYGGKWPLGLGLFFAGLATVFTPLAARTHTYALCFARIVCGLGEGFAFPAMHGLLASWAPPDEKSKLASIVYAGAQFGTAATMIMSGYLIHGNILGGWPSVFYVIGTLTILWFVLWCFFVYDTPAKHPRISSEELNFIEKTIGNQTSKGKVPTPWKAIFSSMPFWAILAGHIGHAWGLYTLLHELPSYLKNMLHFEIRENSWLSALPYIVMWILSIFITQIADWLISRGKLRTVVVRKGCQAIGYAVGLNWFSLLVTHLGSAVLLIAAAFSGCDRVAAVSLLTLSVGVNGAIYGGYVVNHVDIARNHAATLSGITHTIANITGFCVPYVAAIFLSQGNTLENWQYVFFIAAAVYVVDVVFYVIFASATEQPWNRGYVASPSK